MMIFNPIADGALSSFLYSDATVRKVRVSSTSARPARPIPGSVLTISLMAICMASLRFNELATDDTARLIVVNSAARCSVCWNNLEFWIAIACQVGNRYQESNMVFIIKIRLGDSLDDDGSQHIFTQQDWNTQPAKRDVLIPIGEGIQAERLHVSR